MITTRGQKFLMVLFGILSMLLAVVTILPFKTVFEHPNILKIEIVIKLVVIPILVLLISIYPNIYKYRQVKGYREQSKVVSVMSYFPGASYVVGLIVNALYMLTKGIAPLGMVSWCLWFTVLVASLIAICCSFHVFTRFEMQLGVAEHAILDICLFIISICFAVMSFQITKAYHNTMLAEGRIGGIYFTIIAIATFIGFGLHIKNLISLVKDDEVNISIKMADLDATSFVAKTAEYNRAYNDIMDNFENYFADEGDLDVMVEEIEEEPLDEPESVNQETAEKVDSEVVDETIKAEEEDPAKDADISEETPLAENVSQTSETATPKDAEEEIIEVFEEGEPEIVEVIRQEVKKVITVEHVQEEIVAELTEEQKAMLAAKKLEVIQKKEALEEKRQELANVEEEIKALREGVKPIQEEVVKEPNPKVEKPPKNITPSYKALTNEAKSIMGINVIENDKKTNSKFLIGKKPFLLMSDTPNDYRLVFFADLDKIANWMIAEPSIVKAKSPKGDNWFKVANKGQMSAELLSEIIASSHQALIKAEEAQKAAKEQARKEAREKAKAEKAKQKEKETKTNEVVSENAGQ